MPYYPDPKTQDEGIPYDTDYYWHHVVSEYLKCSYFQVLELGYIDFLEFRREAFIVEMSKTKEGREYLQNAKLYESTDADYAGLRKRFGGGSHS